MSVKRRGVCEMMKRIVIVTFGVLLVLMSNGCIFSYHRLEPASRSAGHAQGSNAVSGGSCCMDDIYVLYMWKRTLFYPRYFRYFYRREGSWAGLLLEVVCRLPTILFEVPFNYINSGEKQVEFRLPDIEFTNVDGSARPVVLSKEEVAALLKDERMKGSDIGAFVSEVVYRQGDSIYLVRTYTEQEKLSIFGVDFSSPTPVVWRIDAITGECEVLVSFDTGEFIIENPPRKEKSRYK